MNWRPASRTMCSTTATETPALVGIRFYRRNQRPQESYVYLVLPEDMDRDFRSYENVHFIVFGRTDLHNFSFSSSILSMSEDCDPLEVYNEIQQIFDKYHLWAKSLQWALQSQTPLIKMLEVSREIFENPIFIHDTDFYILACPRWVEGMLHWEKEPRTGRDMVPLDLINEFKLDQEYLSTLVERHVAMFSAAIRGYRILYANLWNGDRYDGRVCVDELERPPAEKRLSPFDVPFGNAGPELIPSKAPVAVPGQRFGPVSIPGPGRAATWTIRTSRPICGICPGMSTTPILC